MVSVFAIVLILEVFRDTVADAVDGAGGIAGDNDCMECGKNNLWTTTKGGSHRVGGMPAVVEILGFARDFANGDEIFASDNRL